MVDPWDEPLTDTDMEMLWHMAKLAKSPTSWGISVPYPKTVQWLIEEVQKCRRLDAGQDTVEKED